jgi:hypothetical protein
MFKVLVYNQLDSSFICTKKYNTGNCVVLLDLNLDN